MTVTVQQQDDNGQFDQCTIFVFKNEVFNDEIKLSPTRKS